jgi:hypothetical protein
MDVDFCIYVPKIELSRFLGQFYCLLVYILRDCMMIFDGFIHFDDEAKAYLIINSNGRQ